METHYFRIVCLGNSNVGKTTMCTVIRKNKFDEFPAANTIGAEFSSTTDFFDQNKKIRVDLWDIAGQEKYRSLVTLFFRYADLFLLIFDISNRNSFVSVFDWINLVFTKCNGNQIMILVANKEDNTQEVSDQEIEDFVEKNRCIVAWTKVSALKKQNIQHLKNIIYDVAISNNLLREKYNDEEEKVYFFKKPEGCNNCYFN